MKLADYGRLLWGSLTEFAFGAIIFVALSIFIDEPTRVAFLRETVSDWLALTGQVLFPAGVAIWITYVNIESTSFGDYLRYQGASRVFHFLFIYPSLVFFVASISLIVCKGSGFLFMTDLVVFLLAYCIAVFFTMILNVASVMRLYGAFRVELQREQKHANDAQVGKGSGSANE